MKDYVRTDCIREGNINSYLADGWEIIETTKVLVEYPDTTALEYHIGLPARVLIDKLLGIIKDYEKYGFKEELFKKIAEENGKNLDDYVRGGIGKDAVAEYMTNYEKVVDNAYTEYGLKRNYDNDYDEIEF